MAKKKTALPAQKKKAAKKSAATPKASKAAKSSRPRSQVLLGMEQVRNLKLDTLCEGMSDERATISLARKNEKAYEQAALEELKRTNGTSYTHAGVIVIRVPGVDKLLVRDAKDEEASTSTSNATKGSILADEDVPF